MCIFFFHKFVYLRWPATNKWSPATNWFFSISDASRPPSPMHVADGGNASHMFPAFPVSVPVSPCTNSFYLIDIFIFSMLQHISPSFLWTHDGGIHAVVSWLQACAGRAGLSELLVLMNGKAATKTAPAKQTARRVLLLPVVNVS